MIRNRVILLVLWLISLLGISFYGGTVSYGFFMILTLIPVVSLVYVFCVIILFKVYQELEGRDITCGKASDFYFTLQNESFFSFCGIRVVFYSSFSSITGLNTDTEYELHPFSGIKKRTVLMCHYMGEYEVGIKKIIVQDFFRLFSLSYNNKEPFRINVKPDIIHLSRLNFGDHMINAIQDSPVNPDETDTLVRDYMPGDDPRFINWKVSGVAGKLMVRKQTGRQQQGVSIIMDSCRYSKRKEDYLPIENKIAETAIALALFFCKDNIPVTAYYMKGSAQKDSIGAGGFEAFYDRMCSFSFKEEYDPSILYEEVLQGVGIYSSKAVFFVIHKWDTPVIEAVSRLSEGNIPVMIYLVSDEAAGDLLSERVSRVSMITIPTDAVLTEVM